MEEKKGIIDYLGHVLAIFGVAMIAMMLFTKAFGDDASEISAMFQLGSRGIPLYIMLQFLALSALIVAYNYLFLTDEIIKSLSITQRYIFMMLSIVVTITVFILIFKWFPIDMWQPWVMFILSFGVSCGASVFITSYKEKLENKKMQEGLDRLKEWIKEEQDEL